MYRKRLLGWGQFQRVPVAHKVQCRRLRRLKSHAVKADVTLLPVVNWCKVLTVFLYAVVALLMVRNSDGLGILVLRSASAYTKLSELSNSTYCRAL